MKRAQEGTGENKANLREEAGKTGSLPSSASSSPTYGGSRDAKPEPWHQGGEHNPVGKDTKTKKGHRGIKATLEERTQDARVGIQREQRQLLRVGDASQRGRDKAGWGMSRVYRVALEHRHRRVKTAGLLRQGLSPG